MMRRDALRGSGNVERQESLEAVPEPPSNHRDLGGLSCTDGAIEPGRIFRGALHDSPLPSLSAGAVHLFDLRSSSEVKAAFPPASDICRHLWPVHDPEWSKDRDRRTEEFYIASGRRQLSLLGPLLTDALEVLSRGGRIYIGCRLGKDRTGVVTLALGSLLGVGREDLVADYCRTGEAYAEAAGWVRAYAARRGEPAEAVARRLAPGPAIPQGLLNSLPANPTAVADQLGVDHGLVERALGSLRTRRSVRTAFEHCHSRDHL